MLNCKPNETALCFVLLGNFCMKQRLVISNDIETLTSFLSSLRDYNGRVSKPNRGAGFYPEKVFGDRLKVGQSFRGCISSKWNFCHLHSVGCSRITDCLAIEQKVCRDDSVGFQGGIPQYTNCLSEDRDSLNIAWRTRN